MLILPSATQGSYKDLFPEEIEIVDFKAFDIEKYHPDVIYIQNHDDEYNYLTSIPQYYFSSNLVNWCEKLIYIPWFTLTEITREDARGWQSMQHFVTKPGVVNADEVIVQSEQMREMYIEYLTDWAGDETKSIWEEKIIVKNPLLETKEVSENISKEIPDQWKKYWYKENGCLKKVVLYHINASSFIDYKEKAVNKIKNVLEIFKEGKEDICLLLSWNTVMEQTVVTNYPNLWEEYQQIIREYTNEDWGIYVENITEEVAVSLCDAYYGDGCKVSQAMVMAEKPVMLQNFDV